MTASLESGPMLDLAREIVDELVPSNDRINSRMDEAIDLESQNIKPVFVGDQLQVPASVDQFSAVTNNRVTDIQPVIKPKLLARKLPVTQTSAVLTSKSRRAAEDILTGTDNRMLAIVGPCSIHDVDEAMRYAQYVKQWREAYGSSLEIIMRAYTEKPRTTLGWKGLAYDPTLDEKHDIDLGVALTRMLALGITGQGVPIAMERLNGLTPPFLDGLVTYDAIGARNVTDQTAREYGSATSSVVGVKNGIEGDLQVAADAIEAINHEHVYMGPNSTGSLSRVHGTGNVMAHMILRGSKSGPNYESSHVAAAVRILQKNELLSAIIVDASHGNSSKNHKNQEKVVQSIAIQVAAGNASLKGMMLESYLKEGKQDIKDTPLKPEISVTDACIDVSETELLLSQLAEAVQARRALAA